MDQLMHDKITELYIELDSLETSFDNLQYSWSTQKHHFSECELFVEEINQHLINLKNFIERMKTADVDAVDDLKIKLADLRYSLMDTSYHTDRYIRDRIDYSTIDLKNLIERMKTADIDAVDFLKIKLADLRRSLMDTLYHTDRYIRDRIDYSTIDIDDLEDAFAEVDLNCYDYYWTLDEFREEYEDFIEEYQALHDELIAINNVMNETCDDESYVYSEDSINQEDDKSEINSEWKTSNIDMTNEDLIYYNVAQILDKSDEFIELIAEIKPYYPNHQDYWNHFDEYLAGFFGIVNEMATAELDQIGEYLQDLQEKQNTLTDLDVACPEITVLYNGDLAVIKKLEKLGIEIEDAYGSLIEQYDVYESEKNSESVTHGFDISSLESQNPCSYELNDTNQHKLTNRLCCIYQILMV